MHGSRVSGCPRIQPVSQPSNSADWLGSAFLLLPLSPSFCPGVGSTEHLPAVSHSCLPCGMNSPICRTLPGKQGSSGRWLAPSTPSGCKCPGGACLVHPPGPRLPLHHAVGGSTNAQGTASPQMSWQVPWAHVSEHDPPVCRFQRIPGLLTNTSIIRTYRRYPVPSCAVTGCLDSRL